MGRSHYQRPSVLRSKGKHPRWYFRYRSWVLTEHGRQYREMPPKMLGLCADVGKRTAEKRRDEFLKTINEPALVIPSQVLFSKFVDTYRNHHYQDLREQTVRVSEGRFRTHLLPAFGALRLCDITRDRVNEFMIGLARKGLSWQTRHMMLWQIRHVFNVATELDYWQGKNPGKGIKLAGSAPDPTRRPLLTLAQYQALLARLEEPYSLMARIATECGLRIGEIRGLQWRDVDGAALRVERQLDAHMNECETKTKRSVRTVTLGHLADDLKRLRKGAAPGDWIFEPEAYETVRKALVAAAKLAGVNIPRFGWHTLRAMYATWKRNHGGADPFELAASLGHTKIQTTAGYSQVDAALEEAKTRRLQEWMLGKVQ